MGNPAGMAPGLLRALDRLKQAPGIAGWYLAGGNAVQWHLRHRESLDLDLFSLDATASPGDLAAGVADARILSATDAIVNLTIDGIPVDLVRYPHPLLVPPKPGPSGFPVAGLLDLATFKLAAVARRGIRRDFWDLRAIIGSGIPLEAACQAYRERFGRAESDLYHVVRALVYFDDAERDPLLPRGLTSAEWEVMKAWFRIEVPKLL